MLFAADLSLPCESHETSASLTAVLQKATKRSEERIGEIFSKAHPVRTHMHREPGLCESHRSWHQDQHTRCQQDYRHQLAPAPPCIARPLRAVAPHLYEPESERARIFVRHVGMRSCIQQEEIPRSLRRHRPVYGVRRRMPRAARY